MDFIRSTHLTFILIFLVSCQTPRERDTASKRHISNNAHQLVTWETKANKAGVRSDEVIRLEHYEIPLRLLNLDIDNSMDKKTQSSLIFEKNGEKYVRWIINPEDTQWHLAVRDFLEQNNLDSAPKKFFDGYLTASRSLILVNPSNGATFSLKVSTNMTGGKWKDKKQTWKDAEQIRKMTKYLHYAIPGLETENLVILDEPFAAGIKSLDQAMVVRSLNDLPSDNFYYLPSFSALHEEEGLRIAKLNGATDPALYWEKNLNQPLARAMSDYFSKTGAWYDSPHGQNFLVELDQNMKPTGRIVLRDLGDSYLLEDFVKNTPFAWIMKNWEEGKVVKGVIKTGIGLIHGNELPSWMTPTEYKELAWSFYRNFEKDFAKRSGVPVTELIKIDSKELFLSYSNKGYPTTSKAWMNFTHYAHCMSGATLTIGGEKCPELFSKKVSDKDCAGALKIILNQ